MTTPKSQLGINYAKLRKQPRKNDSSDMPKEKGQFKIENQYFGIFEEMNKDNLNYLEGLIKQKSTQKRQYDEHFKPDLELKRIHQRAKSTLEEKPYIRDHTMSHREINFSNEETTKNMQSKTMHLPQQQNFEEGEKLFDQFFKLNNSKSDTDVLKESSQHIEKNEDQNNTRRSYETTGQVSSDFMVFLDKSISYLVKSDTDQKKFQVPISKQITKELSLVQKENKQLRIQMDQIEQRLKETLIARKLVVQENQIYKSKVEEQKIVIKELRNDMQTLRKGYQEIVIKYQQLEEYLKKQKQENEQSILALKTVIQNSGQSHKFDKKLDASQLLQNLGRRGLQNDFVMYDSNKVINETNSSSNDDKSNYYNQVFQTTSSQEDDQTDYTVMVNQMKKQNILDMIRHKNENQRINYEVQQLMQSRMPDRKFNKDLLHFMDTSQVRSKRNKQQLYNYYDQEIDTLNSN